MFRKIVIWGNRLKCWKTIPIFWRYRLMSACLSVMSLFSKRIVPFVGSSSKFKERKKVDLPEPEGPIITTTSPFLISVLMFFNTESLPKDLQRLSIRNSASPSFISLWVSKAVVFLSFTASQPPFKLLYKCRQYHDHAQINQGNGN